MITINELIQKLTPFSGQKNVGETIAALNTLTIAVKDEGVENSVRQLIDLLSHNNSSLSDIAFDGVMALAQLKPRASSSMSHAAGSAGAPNQHVHAQAVAKVKSLLIVGLINYSDAPSVLGDMEQFYAKESPNRSSFFGLSATENAAPSVSSHSLYSSMS